MLNQAESSRLERILIDLDCIFDTRAAILNKMDSAALLSVIEDNKYFERHSDFFSLLDSRFDDDTFKRLYGQRTADDIIAKVIATGFLTQLHNHIESCRTGGAVSPTPQTFEITVNVYPYVFTDEAKQALADAIGIRLGSVEAVRLTSVSPDWLTPKALSSAYSQWVTYGPDDWLNLHAKELKNNPIPSFILSGPIRSIKKEIDKRVSLEESARDSKMMLATVIDLELFPLSFFCMDIEQTA